MKISLILLILIFITFCQKKPDIQNSKTEKILSLQEKLKDDKFQKIYNIASLYLDLDFRGASLDGSSKIHEKFFSELWGINGGTSELIWIVENYKIQDIKEIKSDTSFQVLVKYMNAIEVSPIINIYNTDTLLIDSLVIKNDKIISGNQFKVSRDKIFSHIEKLYFDDKKKIKKTLHKIDSAFHILKYKHSNQSLKPTGSAVGSILKSELSSGGHRPAAYRGGCA